MMATSGSPPPAWIVAALSAVLLTAAGCTAVKGFVGFDTSPGGTYCGLVAPEYLDRAQLADAVLSMTTQAAHDGAEAIVYVAVGRSAPSFPSVRFGRGANEGDLGSDAASPGQRAHESTVLARAAAADIMGAVVDAASDEPGLDLLGGVQLCSQSLGDLPGPHTIVVISHGVQRANAVDFLVDPVRAAATLRRGILDALGPDTRMRLVGIGRLDDGAFGQPANRALLGTVFAAWDAVCSELGDRCAITSHLGLSRRQR
jgi:hypothetical protein